jgi:hypothetical protein
MRANLAKKISLESTMTSNGNNNGLFLLPSKYS